MKAKLWQVKFQSRKYSGEHPEVTVKAQNACIALHNGLRKINSDRESIKFSIGEIVDVEWLATED